MKRILLFACVLVIALGGLAGCGGSKSDTELIQDYISDNQAGLDQVKESIKEMMDFSVEAEGSALVYTYKFTENIADVESAKAGMEAELQNQETAMKLVLADMEKIGVKQPVVIYRYLNADGSEITSFEFK